MIGSSTKHALISTGNATFDKFLGGGLLNSSLNLFERQGPSSYLLNSIWNKSLAASTLAAKSNIIYVNFNALEEIQPEEFLSSLPSPRKVKSDILYKDIRGKSAVSQIKIAWRYSARSSSPSDNVPRTDQTDFGLPLVKSSEAEDIGNLSIINVKENFSTKDFLRNLEHEVIESKKTAPMVNIIFNDLLHPFSPMIDDTLKLCQFMFILRCFARAHLEKGAILVSYDTDLCNEHNRIKNQLYNLVDCVVSFYSYETGQNRLTGYKNTDGTLDYIKIPKINSYGFHFQRELSDWGYRLTQNHRYFVVDELSLPPCHDDTETERDNKMMKRNASDLTKIGGEQRPLEQVGPLEDFRELAREVLVKKL